MIGRAVYSSGSNDWSTPQYLYDELNAEFNFTLDPCASTENHKCNTYYTVEQDGLSQSWDGHSSFVNPPYSDIAKWVSKCHTEWGGGKNNVVLLVPSRTDTRWFHTYVYHQAEIRFIKGRLRFGGASENAPFPSMVAIFRAKEVV